jgi:hypothetical protein
MQDKNPSPDAKAKFQRLAQAYEVRATLQLLGRRSVALCCVLRQGL